MPKEKISDVEVVEPKVDGSERNGTLSWLCRHAGQIAKGGIAVVGLLALGGMGYFARSFFAGFFSGGKSAEKGLVAGEPGDAVARSEDLVGFELHDAPIELRDVSATVRKIDFDAVAAKTREDAQAARALDFDALDKQASEDTQDTQSTCALHDTPRSFAQNETLTGHGSPDFTPGNDLTKIWAKAFGGAGNSEARSVQQTEDGGYIVAGYTTSAGAGSPDALIFKLDSSGSKMWAKTFGGAGDDYAYSVQQTTDGGYIVAGWTSNAGTGNFDFLIFKLSSSGGKEWAKTFGGGGNAFSYSVQQTNDNGYIVAGRAKGESFFDLLILKLNVSGSEMWAKTLGRIYNDEFYSVRQTADGGYIVSGTTNSAGAGYRNFLMLKLDEFGNRTWAKTLGVYGVGGVNVAFSVQQTTDSGYIVAGSYYNNVYFIILKFGNSGNLMWTKYFGSGTAETQARSVQQTIDGGYIVAGWTNQAGAGNKDFLILKLGSDGSKRWAKTFGGKNDDCAYSVRQTADGGYVVAGWTSSEGKGSGNILILKLNANGNLRNGCWGQDVSWEMGGEIGILESVAWTTKDAGLILAPADTLVLAGWNLTTTPVCAEIPLINIPIATQTFCCAAGVGKKYSFTLANNTFIDLEGSVLTYNATLNDDSALPAWLRFDPIILSFNGMPSDASAIGNLTVKVIAMPNNPDEANGVDIFTLNVAQTLSATNIAALINYIENTAYTLAPIVITTPSATVAANLTMSDISAGNLTTATSGSVTSTYNPATGLWQARGSRMDVNALFTNLRYQPTANYSGGFNVAVGITDSFGQGLYSTLVAPPFVIPRMIYSNTTRIPLGSSLGVTTDMLSAEDSSVPASSLRFTVSNVAHGQFALVDQLSAIYNFTKQQIADGKIKITQDGTENPMTFGVSVTNGRGLSPITHVIIRINHGPKLDIHPDKIRLTRKEVLVIVPDMINAWPKDHDVPLDPVRFVFTVPDADIQYGRFELLEKPKESITSFTLDGIRRGRVELVSTNDDNPPSFKISVTDGQVSDGPITVNAKFKEPATEPLTSNPIFTLALGAGASAIGAVSWWAIKKKYSAHKKREKYPFANRIRAALNLDIADFESDKGTEFIRTVDVLAQELDKQGINVGRLTHKELQELAIPVADAIRWHTSVRTARRYCMFSSSSIDHKAVREKVSEIANDAARKYREAVAQQAAHTKNTLTEPLISPVIGNA